MKESCVLEFKQEITDTFLKTVSAYANFNTGEIKFGIDNNGNICGIPNPDEARLVIENKINDSIYPRPEFSLNLEPNGVITLKVFVGKAKPYFWKNKAYRRSDTSTIEVDQTEMKRLILEGENICFENLYHEKNNLTFNLLEEKLREKKGLQNLTSDTLRTLDLYDINGKANNAAAIFADENDFSGIDIAHFGDSISIIKDREVLKNISVLSQYDKAVTLYKKYYQYEIVAGVDRILVENIPETAFREALVNALVHRQYDTRSNIKIEMHPEKIIIISPGSLPKGLSKEEYLNGNISQLRNPIIASIFLKLGYIENLATGIRRIRESYADSVLSPSFEVFDNSISVSLPLLNAENSISEAEKRILLALHSGKVLSSGELAKITGFNKAKVLRLTKTLVNKNHITLVGNGRSTRYKR